MQARFIRFNWENKAHTIGNIYALPDRPYYFTPGQYADFGVRTATGPLSRTMTLTSLPSDKLISFTTRFDRRHSPYKAALLNLRSGDPLTITGAMGDLVLPLDDTIPLVFVAGGVAIASFVSMIRWLTQQNDERDIVLLYAVRTTKDIIYTKVFDAYAPIGHLTCRLYTPDVNSAHVWAGLGEPGSSSSSVEHKRLTADEIMKFAAPDSQIYLSGSESMVEQLRQGLQKDHGIPQYRIAFDYFDGYTML